ncbi:MAG: adenosine deaminase [Rhizobiaceae bacterium]|nr:adenosine deaminase [Rhizobiaceae bacterium]
MPPRLPLAELHCHIEGAASPRLVAELGDLQGIDVSDIVADNRFVWHDFSTFLGAYDRVAAVFREPEHYRLLAREHLTGLAAQGAIYAEIFISPDHAESAGLAPADYVAGLAAGLRDAEEDTGILARMIVVGIRHLGPDAVERAARFAVDLRHPLVTGFGLAGDERAGRPADFARAFDTAREAGLGLTAHAGEFCGPEAIAETLRALRPSRLGHGVRAVEDVALVRRIAQEGVTLEICPGSNLALGVYPGAAGHPLRALARAGCRVTVSSDDPTFFATDLAAEYGFAATQGFSEGERIGLTRTAIEAAFIDAQTRGRLEERLTLAALTLGAPGSKP